VWSQFTADVGVGKRLIAASVASVSTTNPTGVQFEIGEGADGSEVAVARFNVAWHLGRYTNWYVPLWKSLTDNARMTLRVRQQAGTAIIYVAALLTVPK
ncbi:hypothetical protein LCGC14_2449680, partial [marine sediment metagenome]